MRELASTKRGVFIWVLLQDPAKPIHFFCYKEIKKFFFKLCNPVFPKGAEV